MMNLEEKFSIAPFVAIFTFGSSTHWQYEFSLDDLLPVHKDPLKAGLDVGARSISSGRA